MTGVTVMAFYRRKGRLLSRRVYGFDTRAAIKAAQSLPGFVMVMPTAEFVS